MTGNSHTLFWLRGRVRESVSALCLRLAVRVSALPYKPKAYRVYYRLSPSLTHPRFLSLSTLIKVCLLVSIRFFFSVVVVRVAQNDFADIPQPADLFWSRTPIRCPKVVSNLCSSHLYSHNRVDDVSNDLLTHIRRVRRCQVNAPKLPRYAYPGLSSVPFYVLNRSVLSSVEGRKGSGEARQSQEERRWA